jgi:hypothetical protein
MTVVKNENYLAEYFVYLFLKDSPLSEITKQTSGFCSPHLYLDYFNNLQRELLPYMGFLKPNDLLDPRQNKQNEWFDLFDKSRGINVKYAYESSANSRIRDLTKESVKELNNFILDEKLMPPHEIKSYEELRNGFFKKIGADVKNRKFPIIINSYGTMYIKLAYLFCMNFIGENVKNRLVIFTKFTKSGQVRTFVPHSPLQRIDFNDFISRTSVSYSSNTPEDAHKKTVKLFFNCNGKEEHIGFFEIRSNGRVMLHLRNGESHWAHLTNNIKFLKNEKL